MIKVTELISGQSFESMKLAAEYFNIPVSVVTASIKSGLKLELNNKEYKFVKRKAKMLTTSTSASPIKRFPFGKYKDQFIRKCTDLSYLKWLFEKDINDRLRYEIRARINELKGEKEI
jgi:hypothetical protein